MYLKIVHSFEVYERTVGYVLVFGDEFFAIKLEAHNSLEYL